MTRACELREQAPGAQGVVAPAGEGRGGLAALVGAATVFSSGFVLVKALPLPPAVIGFWRLLIGAGVLVAVATVLRIPAPRTRWPLVVAGLAFGAHQLVFIAATKATSIAIVTLVGALQPLLVGLVSRRTVGERVPPALLACAGLALLGVAVVVQANLGDPSRSLAGDLLAALNVVLFTTYFLAAKRAREQGDPTVTCTAALLVVALLVVAPAMLLSGESAQVPGGGYEWLGLVVLALLPGNGHLLVNWAHPRVSAALSSLVLAVVPLLSSIWAHLVFGEPYGPRHLVGMLLVLAAIEGGRRVERREAPLVPALAAD